MSEAENVRIAQRWIDAFNAYDVDALVSLYADDATHSSPKIRGLHPETGGKLLGRSAIAKWWRDAIDRLPGLRYEPTTITANGDRVFLEYVRKVANEPDMIVAEVFDVREGKVVASRVYHG